MDEGDEGGARCQLCAAPLHTACAVHLEAWTTYVCPSCTPHVNNARRGTPHVARRTRMLLPCRPRRRPHPVRVAQVESRILATGAATVSLCHESWEERGHRFHRYAQVCEAGGVREELEIDEAMYERLRTLCAPAAFFNRHDMRCDSDVSRLVLYDFPFEGTWVQEIDFLCEDTADEYERAAASAGYTDIGGAFTSAAALFAAGGQPTD